MDRLICAPTYPKKKHRASKGDRKNTEKRGKKANEAGEMISVSRVCYRTPRRRHGMINVMKRLSGSLIYGSAARARKTKTEVEVQVVDALIDAASTCHLAVNKNYDFFVGEVALAR